MMPPSTQEDPQPESAGRESAQEHFRKMAKRRRQEAEQLDALADLASTLPIGSEQESALWNVVYLMR